MDKYVYLTFDDGPNQYTEKILDILKKYNVRASFFINLNNNIKDTIYIKNNYLYLLKRIKDEHHLIGNHSYSHLNFSDLSDYEIISELNDNQTKLNNILKNNTIFMNHIRLPFGSPFIKIIYNMVEEHAREKNYLDNIFYKYKSYFLYKNKEVSYLKYHIYKKAFESIASNEYYISNDKKEEELVNIIINYFQHKFQNNDFNYLDINKLNNAIRISQLLKENNYEYHCWDAMIENDITDKSSSESILNEKNRILSEIIENNAKLILLHEKDYFLIEDIIKVLLKYNCQFRTVD